MLEAETDDGWQKVDITFGAPAGKTKSFTVDLTGKLPAGTRRLRLTQAFELHWDRIALFNSSSVATDVRRLTSTRTPDPGPRNFDQSLVTSAATQVASFAPSHTDLHWRGYSKFADLPWTQPLTPDYDRVDSKPAWAITPSGWVTRYGPVDELLAAPDHGLVLVAGGDELTLKFAADALPPKPAGTVRDFFLFVTGWDKDADYHVARGDEVEPLPWRGMDDQQYGKQRRPAFPSDALRERFNTRWIGPKTFGRRAK